MFAQYGLWINHNTFIPRNGNTTGVLTAECVYDNRSIRVDYDHPYRSNIVIVHAGEPKGPFFGVFDLDLINIMVSICLSFGSC